MKTLINTILSVALAWVFCSCSKDHQKYPDGYDHHYYAIYDYNWSDDGTTPSLQNTTLTVDRDNEELIRIPVKFLSEFERKYDVEVRLYMRNSRYFLSDLGVMTAPNYNFSTPDSLALPGVDFNILDSDLNVLTPIRGDTITYYSIVFPKAKKGVEKLYIKLLNNEDYPHIRCAWFTLAMFRIDNSSTEVLQRTALNHETGQYKVSSISNSYLRRLNIR